MTKTSSKEFDILLNMLNHRDWGSILRTDEYTLAKESGTTVKYVREVLHKFKNEYRNKKVLSEVYADGAKYELTLGKSNLFYSKKDKYCKKYAFMYDNNFMELSIYAKRILLAAAFNFSTTNQNTTYLKVSDFIYRTELSSGLIPSRTTLDQTIQTMNEVYNGVIIVSRGTTLLTKEEVLYVQVQPSLLTESKENRTEREYVRKTLFEAGYSTYLEDEYCLELEKVGKYIFNSLSRTKETAEGDTTKEVLQLGREVYRRSLQKLAGKVSSFTENNKNPKEIAAYFSSIVFTEMVDEMAKHEYHCESIKTLFNQTIQNYDVTELNNAIGSKETVLGIIKNWCENWVTARIKDSSVHKYENESNLDKNNKLLLSLQEFIKPIEKQCIKWGNKAIKNVNNLTVMNLREQITQTLEIKNNRILYADIGNEANF